MTHSEGDRHNSTRSTSTIIIVSFTDKHTSLTIAVATSEMSSDGPMDNIPRSSPLAPDYPNSPSGILSTSVHSSPPPLSSSKSSFVFNSSTSRDWAREFSVDQGRPTLSAFPSFCSINGLTPSSVSSSSLGSTTSELLSNGNAGAIGYKSHVGNWQRPREYQTRLTAEQRFEHAFSSSKQAREREREMIRRSTNDALAPSRSSSAIQLRTESDLYAPDGRITLARRRSSGFTLTYELALRSKASSAAPPKGTFRSRSRLVDRRHSEYNLTLSGFPSGHGTPISPLSTSSTPPPSPPSSSSSSSLDSLSTFYSSVGTSAAVREPLLSREDWEKASMRRTEQRRRSRELSGSCPCNKSATGCDLDGSTLHINPEPISISSEYIGGWIGLETTPTEEIRRYPSLRKDNFSSQARHPFQDLKPRSPESFRPIDGEGEASRCATCIPVTDKDGGTDEEKLAGNVEDENITLTLRRLEIFSQLALYLGGGGIEPGMLSGG